MPYSDFTLDSVEAQLGVVHSFGDLFPNLAPAPVPDWLAAVLAQGLRQVLTNEKTRSEFVAAPVLLAVSAAAVGDLAILSGQRLDVDPDRDLVGECDFLLMRSPPVYRPRAPLMAVVEAKRQDIDLGLGQCIAQMVAVQLFNERAGAPLPAVFGCVTTGEDWQFLRLVDTAVTLHTPRLFINDVGLLLGAFAAALRA